MSVFREFCSWCSNQGTFKSILFWKFKKWLYKTTAQMNLSIGVYGFCIIVSLKNLTSILRMDDFKATISLSYREIKLFNGIFKHWSTSTVGMNTGDTEWTWIFMQHHWLPQEDVGGRAELFLIIFIYHINSFSVIWAGLYLLWLQLHHLC